MMTCVTVPITVYLDFIMCLIYITCGGKGCCMLVVVSDVIGSEEVNVFMLMCL
jgi:hypothetical protein